jgi:tight adherence protein C
VSPVVSGMVPGMVLGATAGLGLVLIAARLRAVHRPTLALRVLPYVRDVPRLGLPRPTNGGGNETTASPASAAAGVFGPVLRAAAEVVERVLGGAASVRRRLTRAALATTVHDFRIEQVLWGVAGFAVVAAYCLLNAVGGRGDTVSSLVLCLVGFATGVLARDTYLTSQVNVRERKVIAEFPVLAELLALAVAAGESPVAALDRVVRRSGGELSGDLAVVLAAIRTGQPVAEAFDRLAAATGVPSVARFAQGVAVAVERGTPLAEVLHAQAADVREAGRRQLIEVAARKEIFMMVPVVFLILPVTVLIAFWPGVIGLHLTTP